MSQKRHPDDPKPRSDGTIIPDHKKRRFNLKNVVQEVIKRQSVQHLLEPILEPLIRRVVKEEVELALRKHLANLKRSSGKGRDYTESRSLKLQFTKNLSLPVFTGARIDGEDCSSMKLVLIDSLTGIIVNSGPESSAKVEIIVLEGDFDGDECATWTREEFKNNIVREREGKKPLLTGDVFLNLDDGIGTMGEISFTDNSSWTRSRRFRLGARVVDSFDGTDIREAKTEPFIVRDHRGELYKKHHPPTLYDEVWRLEKIGKDGAFHKRLSRENITTVKDFLTQLFIDPQKLRHVLGTGMSAKMWEVTVEHARTCVLDKRTYLYCTPGSEQKRGVVFNVVGQITGLLSNSQYVSVDKLSETEKVEAQGLVVAAFEHPEEVLSFEDEASLVNLSNNMSYPSSSPRTESCSGNKLLASHKIGGFGYAQANTCSSSSPDIISSIYSSVGSMSGLDEYALNSIENMSLRYDDQTLNFPGQGSTSIICDTDAMTRAFCDDDHLRFFESQNLNVEAVSSDLQSDLDAFMLPRSTAVAVDKAQRRWTKISSVLKWFSIRKLVTRKTSLNKENRRF
ncbi:Calmodulin binding protein-like [Euphorbia peplus]|nr:Calmodulin binding protein-like [Euphorbia peplus]